MADLHANISIGHENDWNTLKGRIITAAQCNSDAIIISKATPEITIPDNKKYVSINSKWGHLPYIDVAKKSEVDELTVRKINDLT
jgi:sialic acid synthase SpsE